MEHRTQRPTANERRAIHVARFRPLLALPLGETPDRIVPIGEVCLRLNQARNTVWRKVRDGKLPKPVAGGMLARELLAARPELAANESAPAREGSRR
jgi:hypothetical protein